MAVLYLRGADGAFYPVNTIRGEDGTSFRVYGLYASLDLLKAAHPTGSVGEAYAVGTEASNVIYIWDVDAADWSNIGALQGPPGPAGAAGEDGVSPTVNVSKDGKVTTILITDAEGTKTAIIKDGEDSSCPDNAVLYESTLAVLPSGKWVNVTFGNGVFVAVAPYEYGKVAYSSDGVKWDESVLPTTESEGFHSIAYDNKQFVIFFKNYDDGSMKALFSSDGVSWSSSATNLPTTEEWETIAYGGNKFVALAFNSTVAAYSADGINWTLTTAPSNEEYGWGGVAYGNGRFIAVSGLGIAICSTDGVTWNQLATNANILEHISFAKDRFLMFGYTEAYYSVDGATWTGVTLPEYAWSSLAYGNGKFVLASDAGNDLDCMLAYSDDCSSWTVCDITFDNHSESELSVTYGNNKFVAIVDECASSYNSDMVYSEDGVNWTHGNEILTCPDGTDVTENISKLVTKNVVSNLVDGSAEGSVRSCYSAYENPDDTLDPEPYVMGDYAFSEGYLTKASGESSHAEGYEASASGFTAHAEGECTVASGDSSHAEGDYTAATQTSAHAEGRHTTASAAGAHAEGYYTKASSKNQHVQGKYNVEDTGSIYAHIVGNGSSNTARSNAHTLDWDGNAWFKGDVYVGSTSGTSKDDGSAKLQKEITGAEGQIVGFDSDGKPIAQDAPTIPDVSGYMPKAGGTFTASVYAMGGTGTAAQLRNTALVSSETYPTVNGQINWQYE